MCAACAGTEWLPGQYAVIPTEHLRLRHPGLKAPRHEPYVVSYPAAAGDIWRGWKMTDEDHLLARYNDEVAHGLVHTDAWRERMWLAQQSYDERCLARIREANDRFGPK